MNLSSGNLALKNQWHGHQTIKTHTRGKVIVGHERYTNMQADCALISCLQKEDDLLFQNQKKKKKGRTKNNFYPL